MMLIFLLHLCLFAPDFSSSGRDATGGSLQENILFLSGAGDISQADPILVEHLTSLADKPLKINCASRSSLISSGLFSSYQAESILDWRSRNGDILSEKELGIVDAFTPVIAAAMAPFLSFEPSSWTAARSFSGEALGSFAVKVARGEGTFRWQDRLKCAAATSMGTFSASASVRSPWKNTPAPPDEYPWYVSYEGRRWLSKVIAGNFNVRLAQGIAIWSGTTISDGSTPESLMRKSSGISPYGGFAGSSSMFGVALRADFGHFDAMAFADHSHRQLGGSIGWNHRHGSVGVNAVYPQTAVSTHVQQTLGGSVLFGEVCLRPRNGPGTVSALAGCRFPVFGADCALRASYVNEIAQACAALQCLSTDRKHNLISSLSYEYKGTTQVKCRAMWKYAVTEALSLCTRAAARLRSWEKNRYELRQEAEYSMARWSFSLRGDIVRCSAHALLLCMETSFEGNLAKACLQCGAFAVDNWDDRIYVYRHDTPQSFNIPAYYGRGYWMAAYCRMTAGKYVKLYLTVDYTSYPWARQGDTHTRPSAGAKLQCTVGF